MSTVGQGTQCRRNINENLNRLSRTHERYRQQTDRQTDGRATANSERDVREKRPTLGLPKLQSRSRMT